MRKVYLLVAAVLLAGLAATMPLYEAPEAKPKPITIGQDDVGRRADLYRRDVETYGESKAEILRRVRERSDSSIAFPQQKSP